MAQASITQRWADGSEIDMVIHVDDEFPDAIDEARVQVAKLWRETCAETETQE